MKNRVLIAHVIFRLDVGALENGLVNLVNGLPVDRFRHAIICLDNYTEFSKRLTIPDVELVAIRKRDGHDLAVLVRLFRTFRNLKLDMVHTRNAGALDALLPACLARVPCRVHGEHGWDTNDLTGTNKKMQLIRRLYAPMVHQFVALSGHIEEYLVSRIGISKNRITRVCNGVDTRIFYPDNRSSSRSLNGAIPFNRDHVIVGTVCRLQEVKDPITLIDSMSIAVQSSPDMHRSLRLIIVGDGPLKDRVIARIQQHGLEQHVWLSGASENVPDLLRCMDLFVQSSLAEGISNTILEAMSTGLPVVATNVGGNSELVEQDVTGSLVDPSDSRALAAMLVRYASDRSLRTEHGAAGRRRIESQFSIEIMINMYRTLYETLLR